MKNLHHRRHFSGRRCHQYCPERANFDELQDAAEWLKGELAKRGHRPRRSFREGKEEIQLTIKPEAEALGLTQVDLARQVRSAFYGEELQRIQRGRDDVRVMLRYPQDERRSLANLENMRIRLPGGTEIPFNEVAQVTFGRGYESIRRIDRRRAVNVTADVDASVGNTQEINRTLDSEILPKLRVEFPGVYWGFEGEQSEQAETVASMSYLYGIALIIIYGLLAIPFSSYIQPIIVMAAIPFGLIGAIWGHIVMGMDVTILSGFGVVALTGVVVNDSLVMVDYVNRKRGIGLSEMESARQAGMSRFRPIILTSLTTFAGLTPLLLEKSLQAKFLVPMGVSLGFGVIFATVITLILVPSMYLILEDIRNLPRPERQTIVNPAWPSTWPGAGRPLLCVREATVFFPDNSLCAWPTIRLRSQAEHPVYHGGRPRQGLDLMLRRR